MGGTTIRLRDDVFEALKAEKAENESFSDVIDRLLEARSDDHPLYSIIGVLSDEDAERIRESIENAD